MGKGPPDFRIEGCGWGGVLSKTIYAVFLGILMLCRAPGSTAASFACSGELTPTEIRICTDVRLSNLDEQLSAVYREALANSEGSPQNSLLRDTQRQWLRQRERCLAEPWCLEQTYTRRVNELSPNLSSASSDQVENSSNENAEPNSAALQDQEVPPVDSATYAEGGSDPAASDAQSIRGRSVSDGDSIGDRDVTASNNPKGTKKYDAFDDLAGISFYWLGCTLFGCVAVFMLTPRYGWDMPVLFLVHAVVIPFSAIIILFGFVTVANVSAETLTVSQRSIFKIIFLYVYFSGIVMQVWTRRRIFAWFTRNRGYIRSRSVIQNFQIDVSRRIEVDALSVALSFGLGWCGGFLAGIFGSKNP
jgi:uncharacterized protein